MADKTVPSDEELRKLVEDYLMPFYLGGQQKIVAMESAINYAKEVRDRTAAANKSRIQELEKFYEQLQDFLGLPMEFDDGNVWMEKMEDAVTALQETAAAKDEEIEKLLAALESFRVELVALLEKAGIAVSAISDDPPTTCLTIARGRIESLESQLKTAREAKINTTLLAAHLHGWMSQQSYQGEPLLHAIVSCDIVSIAHFIQGLDHQIEEWLRRAADEAEKASKEGK